MDTETNRAPEIYFAQLEGEDLITALKARFDAHVQRMRESGRHERMRRSWLHYYSRDAQGGWNDTTKIQSAGRQGEMSLLRPNRYRARMQRLLNMNAGSKPSWDCVALNSDAQTSRQAQLGDHIIEHYGSREKLYERLLERDEHALVFGEAYIGAIWDPNRGEIFQYADVPEMDDRGEPITEDVEEENEVEQVGDDGSVQMVMQMQTVTRPKMTERPVYKGDFRFLVLSPYDCAIESYSEDRDRPNWCLFRYQVNRYDLARVYPTSRDAIMRADPCSKSRADMQFLNQKQTEDDAVWVYEFYHVRSPGCPRGRSVRYIESDTEPLITGPLKYQGLPVFRTAPGDVMLQDGGHTPGFDLLPLVEARQSHISTLLSNQTAGGAQAFEIAKNSGLEKSSLNGILFFHTNSGDAIKPLKMSQATPEMFTFLDLLESEEDFVTGLNAAARGDAQAMKGDSGAKGALILSAAQQMQTRFQSSRALADSRLFTHVIDTLKIEASVERMIEVAGLANTYGAETFVGEDLKGVSRVIVQPANPLKDTPEGRAQLFEAYMKMGVVRTPEDAFQVMTTGTLAHVDEEWTAELTLIKQENELLSDEEWTEAIPVMPTDAHAIHLRKHRCVFSNPRLRTNAELLKRYQAHIMEHMNALMQLPPQLLMALGEQPMQAPQQPQGEGGEMSEAAAQGPGNMPKMPSAPKNPATGQTAQIAPTPELQAQVPA